MALASDILRMLKDEGYRTNEVIQDALDEFLSVVEDENEGMDDDIAEDEAFDEDD